MNAHGMRNSNHIEIKLDESKISTGSTRPLVPSKHFCDMNADVQSVCGS